jgi:serine/threonine protein kinase
MSPLPHTAKIVDLLKWVSANPNQPFDPTMVVSLSTGHTSDWEWQIVLVQMEDLRNQAYITRLKQDAAGATYWTINQSGERYLQALRSFEQEREVERLFPPGQTAGATGGASLTFIGGWEQLKPLGEGGQSRVFLVRGALRVQERRNAVQQVLSSNPWAAYAGGNANEQVERIERLAINLSNYSRPDDVSELGALKMFKIDNGKDAEQAIGRLKNEITVLRQNRPGLVRLLDANENEKWVVTEYMPDGALDKNPTVYQGNALGALRAFKSLVETVAGLHKDKYVHRDIKPANVFLARREKLVLGDFGIVYIPDQQGERLTVTEERVGPRDYMPQWGDLGERLENVHAHSDVYMLGKLLWCMVTGRLKLPREYHDRPKYDIKILFPADAGMVAVDAIIKKCVVEEPDQCLASAVELLALVDEQLNILERGGQALMDGAPRPCHICGKGQYHKAELEKNVVGKPVVNLSLAGKPVEVSMFICDVCRHVQFFAEQS